MARNKRILRNLYGHAGGFGKGHHLESVSGVLPGEGDNRIYIIPEKDYPSTIKVGTKIFAKSDEELDTIIAKDGRPDMETYVDPKYQEWRNKKLTYFLDRAREYDRVHIKEPVDQSVAPPLADIGDPVFDAFQSAKLGKFLKWRETRIPHPATGGDGGRIVLNKTGVRTPVIPIRERLPQMMSRLSTTNDDFTRRVLHASPEAIAANIQRDAVADEESRVGTLKVIRGTPLTTVRPRIESMANVDGPKQAGVKPMVRTTAGTKHIGNVGSRGGGAVGGRTGIKVLSRTKEGFMSMPPDFQQIDPGVHRIFYVPFDNSAAQVWYHSGPVDKIMATQGWGDVPVKMIGKKTDSMGYKVIVAPKEQTKERFDVFDTSYTPMTLPDKNAVSAGSGLKHEFPWISSIPLKQNVDRLYNRSTFPADMESLDPQKIIINSPNKSDAFAKKFPQKIVRVEVMKKPA